MQVLDPSLANSSKMPVKRKDGKKSRYLKAGIVKGPSHFSRRHKSSTTCTTLYSNSNFGVSYILVIFLDSCLCSFAFSLACLLSDY